jgi:hypothetical protein
MAGREIAWQDTAGNGEHPGQALAELLLELWGDA